MNMQDIEMIRVCSDCENEIEKKPCGDDDSLDYCTGCGNIEGPTKEISLDEFENR